MATTLRDYLILAVILLALAVTGYVQVRELLVNVARQLFIQMEAKR